MKHAAAPLFDHAGSHCISSFEDEFFNNLSIDLKEYGYVSYLRDETIERRGPYNEIQLIIGGTGHVIRGRKRFRLDAPLVSFLPLSDPVTIENHAKLMKVFFQCNIRYSGVDILLNESPLFLPLTENTDTWWDRAVRAIDSANRLSVYALLYDALACAEAELTAIAKRKRAPYKRFERYFEYVRRTPLRSISLPDVAAEYGLHRNYFSQEFKRQFGMPAKAYALMEKLRAAKAMLLETDDEIPSISEVLGFFDRFHFSKLFKKHTGCTPVEFRKRHETGAAR
ncbi:MAG: helix-turn-helix transcriptional regulator [Spirochaetes bacterium]|nr:helix-turn-helix transcriptional regulator [Spirochaetota bacterium]